MTEAAFRREMKTGLAGTYVLYGEEDYLKRFYAGRAQTLTLSDDATLAAFNMYTMGADAPDLDDLQEAVLAVPVMGDKVFVQYMANLNTLGAPGQKQLMKILAKVDPESTVCLLTPPAGGFDPGKPERGKPSPLYKKLETVCTMVNMTVYPPGELKKWMARRLERAGVSMTEQAADAMLQRCGKDMYILSGELDKLAAYARANEICSLEPSHIHYVTCAVQEEDAFALANAVLAGDRGRALSVLSYYKKNQISAVAALASVSKAICDMLTVSRLAAAGYDQAGVASALKMHTYRAGLYLSAVRGMEPARLAAAAGRCREADVLLKSTKLDYIALERVICTIPAKKAGGMRHG